MYAAYTYGPPGRRVKVFLLDTRYNRDAKWSDGDVLGEAQWQWLDHELETSDAQIHIIASSVQVRSLELFRTTFSVGYGRPLSGF